jgi:hypothetical protein
VAYNVSTFQRRGQAVLIGSIYLWTRRGKMISIAFEERRSYNEADKEGNTYSTVIFVF